MCKFYGENLSTQPNSTIPEGEIFQILRGNFTLPNPTKNKTIPEYLTNRGEPFAKRVSGCDEAVQSQVIGQRSHLGGPKPKMASLKITGLFVGDASSNGWFSYCHVSFQGCKVSWN